MTYRGFQLAMSQSPAGFVAEAFTESLGGARVFEGPHPSRDMAAALIYAAVDRRYEKDAGEVWKEYGICGGGDFETCC